MHKLDTARFYNFLRFQYSMSDLSIVSLLSPLYLRKKLSIVFSDKNPSCRWSKHATAYASTYCAVQVSGSDPPTEFPFSPFFFPICPYGLNSRENRIFRSIGDAFYVRRMQEGNYSILSPFGFPSLESALVPFYICVPRAFVGRNSYLFLSPELRIYGDRQDETNEMKSKEQSEKEKQLLFCLGISVKS